MTFRKKFARVVWWRYWKQLQAFLVTLGHLTYTGFIFPKIPHNEYNKHPKQAN